MTQHDLRQVREASAQREHGSRARYMAGCKCLQCRAANSNYETERAKLRAAGDWNGIVKANKARNRIRALSKAGIGYRTVADAAGVSISVVHKIRTGEKKQIRARTERLILGVTKAAAGDAVLVPAGPTWRRIEQLQEHGGFTKSEIARRLGRKFPALTFGSERVTLRTHDRIKRFWDYYLGNRGGVANALPRLTAHGSRITD